MSSMHGVLLRRRGASCRGYSLRSYYRQNKPYKGRFMYKPISMAGLEAPSNMFISPPQQMDPHFVHNLVPDVPVNYLPDELSHKEAFQRKPDPSDAPHAAIIYLNRWREQNAYDTPTLKRFADLIQKYSASKHHSCIIWQAKGDHLSTGTDIYDLANGIFNHSLDTALNYYREMQRTSLNLATSLRPTVVMLNGNVFGPGFGFALNSAVPIATESSRLCATGCRVGLLGAEAGISYKLSRLPFNIGEYLLVSGRPLHRAELVHLGLSDFYIPSDRLSIVEESLGHLRPLPLDDLLQAPLTQIDKIRHKLDLMHDTPPESCMALHYPAIQRCFGQPTLSGVIKALEEELKNPEHSEWSRRTLEELQLGNPMAMAATLRVVQLARHIPFMSCLQLEYTIAARLLALPDAKEGLSAFIEGRLSGIETLKISDNDPREDYLSPVWETLSSVHQEQFAKRLLLLFNPLPEQQRLRLSSLSKHTSAPSRPDPTVAERSAHPESVCMMSQGAYTKVDEVLHITREAMLQTAGNEILRSFLEHEESILEYIQSLEDESDLRIKHTISN